MSGANVQARFEMQGSVPNLDKLPELNFLDDK
jgi:hypothetical protein